MTLAGLWALSACASSEPPIKQLADAQASIRAANELGADQSPEAALHVKLARDRVERAQALNREGEHEQAKHALEEADHDAEVAVALLKQQASEDRAAAAKQKADEAGAKSSAKEPGFEKPAAGPSVQPSSDPASQPEPPSMKPTPEPITAPTQEATP
jgi:hypothetical protein